MAKLLYQGHASVRLTTEDGVVIYIDPFAGEGYDKPADIILVTHEHGDHNRLSLPAKKDGCAVIRYSDAFKDGKYQTISLKGVTVTAVPAENKNHKRGESVGYVVACDGIKLYHAGDTSTFPEMRGLKDLHLDYALLPTDGFYNMDAAEAAECANAIGARVSIPIHSALGNQVPEGILYDPAKLGAFTVPGGRIVVPGEEIAL
jgi:L-ascorbate metabolism protein UlaG (beta-lactamase superfamily)